MLKFPVRSRVVCRASTVCHRTVSLRLLAAALFGSLMLLPAWSLPAAAHWHGHHGHVRVTVGFGAFFGSPAFYGYPYSYPAFSGYPYSYYAPPPVYYAPRPVYVVPPPTPIYIAPAPRVVTNCQTYHGDAIIDASGRPFYGTACLEADGRWHIVN